MTGENDSCLFRFVAVLYFDYIPWWGALLISAGVGLVSMLLVQFVLVPYERKRVVGECGVLCCAHVCTPVQLPSSGVLLSLAFLCLMK